MLTVITADSPSKVEAPQRTSCCILSVPSSAGSVRIDSSRDMSSTSPNDPAPKAGTDAPAADGLLPKGDYQFTPTLWSTPGVVPEQAATPEPEPEVSAVPIS